MGIEIIFLIIIKSRQKAAFLFALGDVGSSEDHSHIRFPCHKFPRSDIDPCVILNKAKNPLGLKQ